MTVSIAAFYRFAPVPDLHAVQTSLAELACGLGVRGIILVAPEGVNGTIAGTRDAVEAVLARVADHVGALTPRWSEAEEMPFGRLKVRQKREIVTLGQTVDATQPGRYIAPEDWNAVIQDPDTVVIDVRNDYEVAIGSFEGAEDPETEAFGEIPAWWEANRERLKGKRVAMFCTGGIRCEKSTALLKEAGHADVVHLKGGILGYLEPIPEEDSLWHGGCFVFDDRVAVGHGLRPTGHVMCHACRRPLSEAHLADPAYEPQISCPHCIDETSEADRDRFRERAKQMRLARERGEVHLGRGAQR
jgi:UPF0176 protein